jgi:hypothetical protein
MASIATGVLSGLGGLASGISGAIQQSQENALKRDYLELDKQKLAQANTQFNSKLDFERMNAASNRDLQRFQLNNQNIQNQVRMDWSTRQTQDAREYATNQRDENIKFLSHAAEAAGVPEWQILSGRVPNVARNLGGGNFNIVPAGGDPYVFNQGISN